MNEVVAHFAPASRNLLHFLAANIAEFAFDGLLLCPTVSNRILYKGGRYPHAWVDQSPQTSLVDQEVANLAKKAGVDEAPEIFCAVMTVDGPCESLLGKGVAVVVDDGGRLDRSNGTIGSS